MIQPINWEEPAATVETAAVGPPKACLFLSFLILSRSPTLSTHTVFQIQVEDHDGLAPVWHSTGAWLYGLTFDIHISIPINTLDVYQYNSWSLGKLCVCCMCMCGGDDDYWKYMSQPRKFPCWEWISGFQRGWVRSTKVEKWLQQQWCTQDLDSTC